MNTKDEIKIIYLVLMVFFGLFIVGYAYVNTKVYTFGTIEMDKVINFHVDKYAKRNITDEIRHSETKLFSKILTRKIETLKKNDKIILLTKPAVVTNLKDYTDSVILDVNKEFKDEISK